MSHVPVGEYDELLATDSDKVLICSVSSYVRGQKVMDGRVGDLHRENPYLCDLQIATFFAIWMN